MKRISKIEIAVPDQQALNTILSTEAVATTCSGPKRRRDGTFVVTVYAPEAAADKLTALGYPYEVVDEHYECTLMQRKSEVSKIDRFNGGAIKPEGLGVKR
jgi:hypothetical protein